jgi:predicted acylesterase/phospholipase RssA
MAFNRLLPADSSAQPIKLSELMAEAIHERAPFDLDKVTNLVISGGAAKGIILSSVIGALGIINQIENIAASSIGTITGAGLAVGLSPNHLMMQSFQIVYRGEGTKFSDVTNPANPKDSLVRKLFYGAQNLKTHGGFFLGDHIEKHVGDMLESKENKLPDEFKNRDLTFMQLHQLKIKYPEKHFIDLYFTAWDCKEKKPIMLSWESKEYCDLPIRKGVRYSTSVPIAYRPAEGRFWDGAFNALLPINTFDHQRFLPPGEKLWNDKNMRTLALAFSSPKRKKEPKPATGISLFSLPIFSIFNSVRKSLMRPFLLENLIFHLNGDDCRTFTIDASKMSASKFEMNADELTEIFIDGDKQGTQFREAKKKQKP